MEMRAITGDDRDLLARWLSTDPHHSGMTPEMFLAEPSDLVMFRDHIGDVIATRLTTSLRLGVQFDVTQKARNAFLLGPAFALVMEKARRDKFSEIIFESTSPSLVDFCCKRLGFVPSHDELVYHLSVPGAR